MNDLQRICVYCASSPGRNDTITAATRALGQLLVDEGIALVYGGGSVGLMGLLADTVMAGGGRVHGVIPTRLFSKEIAHTGLTELIEVDSMHERKTRMFELADAFIALPGGFGTLEEVAEVTTWAQLGLHQKPIGVLNIDGYYDALLAFLQRGVQEQLLRPGTRSLLLDADEPAAMLAALRAYEAPPRPQWLGLAQT
ncbi:MAG: TIGR00730 family Rossman fold protein [Myxococcota bacterium]